MTKATSTAPPSRAEAEAAALAASKALAAHVASDAAQDMPFLKAARAVLEGDAMAGLVAQLSAARDGLSVGAAERLYLQNLIGMVPQTASLMASGVATAAGRIA